MAGGPILSAIVRRNLRPGDTRDVSQALLHLHTVRLDREGITTLKNLEVVKEVHSLYLQENLIKKIENVDVLNNLCFLSLSWNKVEEIQNIRSLTNLQFLDISHNLIRKLDAGELPQSLVILDLTGNPCTKAKDYRQQVLEALPVLQQLDGETVKDTAHHNSDNEEEEDGSDSEDSDETNLPFDVSGGLSSVSQEMIQRSYQRRHRALREHEERLSELNNTPNEQPINSLKNDTGNAIPQECTSMSLQQTSVGTTPKAQNSITSEKMHPNSALIKKQLKDKQINGTNMSASKPVLKNQISPSSCQPKQVNSSQGLNKMTSKKLPSPAPQSISDAASTGKSQGTVTTSQKDRQTISAPSSRKMLTVPTKQPYQTPEKTSARKSSTTVSSRPQNERQATSAPTRQTLQSPEKLPLSKLKINSNAQVTTKKTS
ncbi:leucine-rich repeat-containing protein 46 [Phyllobates terribilis]|uniref:leucine-rich repeat-containing protein 46 n=1 Tax=Phyllobates terribilis TaxID=111132 RepID=UPI003CCAE0EC